MWMVADVRMVGIVCHGSEAVFAGSGESSVNPKRGQTCMIQMCSKFVFMHFQAKFQQATYYSFSGTCPRLTIE